MRHLDLFSGIGGFALAADWVWPDVEHIFCEIDPFCQDVLEKHWPDAPIYGDIWTLTKARYTQDFGDPGTIDLLTGGFPCQPFSAAGRKLGREDDRDLWPEMLRIIKDFRPRWIIGENVAHFVRMELDRSLSDLESENYSCQAFIIPACAVNAPHQRDRVWIVAHSKSVGVEEGRPARLRDEAPQPMHPSPFRSSHWREVYPELCRVDDGVPNAPHRGHALGNAIVPQVAAEVMRAINVVDASPQSLNL